jgi:hypothetical protein
MPIEPNEKEQAEQTPNGLTVPVPKRDEFFGNLKKVAEPEKKSEPSSGRDASASDE